MHNFL